MLPSGTSPTGELDSIMTALRAKAALLGDRGLISPDPEQTMSPFGFDPDDPSLDVQTAHMARGWMFWLSRKMFSGSYLVLISTSRL